MKKEWWCLKTPVVFFLDFVNFFFGFRRKLGNLRSLSSDSARKLDVLGHDGDTLGVNGEEVGVLEKSREIGFRRLLQS